MIVLDTNVVSEALQSAPAPAVARFLKSYRSEDLFTTSITEAEMRTGAALLPTGRRRRLLESELDRTFNDFGERLLAFGSAASRQYAAVQAARARAGRPIQPLDAQIAAIARAKAFSVATRNVRDFENCGVKVIDPWAFDGK